MTVKSSLEKECMEWYEQNRELYKACGGSIQRLLTILLEQAGIAVHSIQYRIKEQDSFINKCCSSRYTDPLRQITDVCGLRVITYTNKDVEDICRVIEKNFHIDVDHSENKAELLKENEVGYLSVHYIAKLTQARTNLDEYKPYRDLRFEIQIRTLLQHAWAEIEHDRSYKFSGELPKDIKRRFYLVAGTLELVDREFNSLAREIEKYADAVHTEAKSGNLNFDIDSTSLFEYLKVKLKAYPDIKSTFCDKDKDLIQELKDCGITTLASLDDIMDSSIVKRVYEASSDEDGNNYLGFVRDMLMVTLPEIYFSKAWNHHWGGIKAEEFSRLVGINPALNKFDSLFDVIP